MSAVLENALYYKLTTSSGVTSLLSNSTAVYPVGESPATPPEKCIIYSRVSTTRVRHLNGTNNRCQVRIQLDCYAKSAADARAIADAVSAAIDGFKGNMGATGATVVVQSISLDNDASDYEPPVDGSARGFWRTSQDYIIWYITS